MSKRRRVVEGAWLGGLLLLTAGLAVATVPVPTTKKDFATPGTQPLELTDALVSPTVCSFCHADYNEEHAPFNRWAHTLMAQSNRDPVFKAALAVAESDAAFVAESCLRCHAPAAWLAGRVQFNTDTASPGYGKHVALSGGDLHGVSCSVCHRSVDPVYTPGVSPPEDQGLLAALSTPLPLDPHNGSFVIDKLDRRRGPFNLEADFQAAGLGPWPGYHQFLQSPFHQSSRMCASCHDVSSAHFTRQPNGSYALNDTDEAGPPKSQQFPEQRTYSEWANSLFAQGPVNLGGRFGGDRADAVSSCQDCHMPTVTGEGCALEPPTRPNLPQHNFAGANSWVIAAVRRQHFDSETGMTEQGVIDALIRNAEMLAAASDLEVSAAGDLLTARIVNFTGHKLPTGYPEGRRMWINVRFLDGAGAVLAERGAYDPDTATLTTSDTKVYEAEMGLDAAIAAATGRPQGPAFRLALNNTIFKDNRIPPMGFTNAAFNAAGAGHVPANLYPDGQYWDDTAFAIPEGAASAQVRVYHQTSTREYMEFLRDNGGAAGLNAFAQWEFFGRSEPVLMDEVVLPLGCACDADSNGTVNVLDIFAFLSSWFAGNGDFDGQNGTTVIDIFAFLSCWFAGC